jgi:hypothetical protein
VNRLVTELSGVRATALLALYARALDNGSAHPILGDRWAEEIITRLDFDFTQFRTAKKERYGLSVRTRQMDEWTTDFITDHPDATVLDLGGGLDSRVFRVNPPARVTGMTSTIPMSSRCAIASIRRANATTRSGPTSRRTHGRIHCHATGQSPLWPTVCSCS